MSDSLSPNPAPEGDAPSQSTPSPAPAAAATAAATRPERVSLEEQLRSLQRLFVAALLVVLLFSGVLNLYFLRQLVPARKELSASRERVQQMVAHYEQNQAPAYQAFLNQLQAFARAHPDFAPRLTRHGVAPASAPAAPAPAPPPAN